MKSKANVTHIGAIWVDSREVWSCGQWPLHPVLLVHVMSPPAGLRGWQDGAKTNRRQRQMSGPWKGWRVEVRPSERPFVPHTNASLVLLCPAAALFSNPGTAHWYADQALSYFLVLSLSFSFSLPIITLKAIVHVYAQRQSGFSQEICVLKSFYALLNA